MRTRTCFSWCLVLLFGLAAAESPGQTPSAVANGPATWHRWETAGDVPPIVPQGSGALWKWVTDPEKNDYWEKALQ